MTSIRSTTLWWRLSVFLWLAVRPFMELASTEKMTNNSLWLLSFRLCFENVFKIFLLIFNCIRHVDKSIATAQTCKVFFRRLIALLTLRHVQWVFIRAERIASDKSIAQANREISTANDELERKFLSSFFCVHDGDSVSSSIDNKLSLSSERSFPVSYTRITLKTKKFVTKKSIDNNKKMRTTVENCCDGVKRVATWYTRTRQSEKKSFLEVFLSRLC